MPRTAAPPPHFYGSLPNNRRRRGTRRIAGLLFTVALVFGTALSAQAGAAITPDSGGTGGGLEVSGSATIPAFVQTSSSSGHSAAVASDGSAWTWGGNFYGQLGDGTTDSRSEPVQVMQSWPTGTTITSISAGVYHSVALASDGTVWAWGVNGPGQLGDGTNADSSVPVQVSANWPAGVTIESVDAGYYHSVALASDGSVWTWGANFAGEIGDGTTTSRNEPVQVAATWPADLEIAGVNAGFSLTAAVASNGSVWIWGSNGYGQLGDGTTASSSTPVQVVATWPTGTSIETVSAGSTHCLAVASDGSIWAWGDNVFGELGDGTASARSTPVQVAAAWPGGVTIESASAGVNHSVAVASDGSVWAWGGNQSGQLGNGSNADSAVPLEVPPSWPGTVAATAVSTGDQYSLALASNGSIWSWGFNGDGQLGDGSITDRTSAVAVLTALTVTGVTFDAIPGTNLGAGAGTGTFTVTTPAHGEGPVGLAISTQYGNGAAGPTFVVPDGFSYVLAQSPAPSSSPAPSATATTTSTQSPIPTTTSTPGPTVTPSASATPTATWKSTATPGSTSTPTPTETPGPTPASTTPASMPVLTVDVAQVAQGGMVELAGAGFGSGEEVELAVRSEPMQLGSAFADQNGAFTVQVQIPAYVPAGSHTLTASEVASGAMATAPLEVTEADIPFEMEESYGYELAWTGTSATIFSGAGILTLLLGAGLVGTRRRKGKARHR